MTIPATTSKTSTLIDDEDREWIARQVAAAPPLSTGQRDKLAELLRPVRRAGTPTGGGTTHCQGDASRRSSAPAVTDDTAPQSRSAVMA